ncbi:MAG TPA: NAD-dependent epimerase/dehydratase family protein [Thermoanaerobaculia bacterium]|jgi:nucleoside-diphosphate-sugar epimerase|nr:NAD-dependent epimerase/dehydratase family protein [Thermoanaerobaculia bacterium]
MIDLRGRKVFVTGATGGIGGRLVERLVRHHGADVRVLIRNPSSAARLARFPLTFHMGDVTRSEDLDRAIQGSELVFHCAYGTTGSQKHHAWVNRVGTERVLEAAHRAGASRVVHLSTLMVYGRTGDGDLDETAPRRRFGNAYSDSKLEAEAIALQYSRSGRVQVAVLQPTAVYGPYGGVWTTKPLQALKAGRQILINGGDGFANAVYVDDLVTAMLLAAVRDGAAGEAFLISGPEPVSWRELYERFARMLGDGPERTVSMTADEAREYHRKHQRETAHVHQELLRQFKQDQAFRDRLMGTRELMALREMASSILPEGLQQRIKGRMSGNGFASPPRASGELPILPLTPEMIDFYIPKTRVRIDKARRLLGYEPAFSLERGMELTEQWARWADLVFS